MAIRQPVVSVLGHVDHGKTKLLDRIRGTSVQAREAGAITQHIGATEVPIEHIYKVCGKLIGNKKFDVPGLLFIDTPGHHSFISLRARGGSLADIAILVIDIKEGIMPQTLESINILRKNKTPFVIALNKVDTIQGWNSEDGRAFVLSERTQMEHAVAAFNEQLYKIIGDLSYQGIFADRYDRIEDFTKTVALVPISAKEGEGIPDLLLMLIGLAQRFLEQQLRNELGPGRGTILEIKEEKGLGKTLDMILYSGVLKQGDTVALGTKGAPLVTKIKAILKPKPLDEIRDPRDRFDRVKELHAAAGVKISCQQMDDVVAGAPIVVVKNDKDPAIKEMVEENSLKVELSDNGVYIKADTIGSLEALAFEAKEIGIPIRKHGIGEITRRDVVETAAVHGDPINNIILAFNVNTSKDADAELVNTNVKLFSNQVVYRLIEEYTEWAESMKKQSDSDKRDEFPFPAKFLIMPDKTFRASKPAIVGIRVISGRIRPGVKLIDGEGKYAGKIRSLRDGEDVVKEAKQGDEVACGIDDITIGRQVKENDTLYIDLNELSIKEFPKLQLTDDERLVLDEVVAIKRKESPFWGM